MKFLLFWIIRRSSGPTFIPSSLFRKLSWMVPHMKSVDPASAKHIRPGQHLSALGLQVESLSRHGSEIIRRHNNITNESIFLEYKFLKNHKVDHWMYTRIFYQDKQDMKHDRRSQSFRYLMKKWKNNVTYDTESIADNCNHDGRKYWIYIF